MRAVIGARLLWPHLLLRSRWRRHFGVDAVAVSFGGARREDGDVGVAGGDPRTLLTAP